MKEIGVHQRVNFSIQHRFHIAGLHPCSMVLDQLIRREDIGPDLRTPRDLLLFTSQGLDFLLLLLPEMLVEPGRG